MTILNINTDYTGQVGILPRTVKIICDDSYATVTTAGYLNNSVQNPYNYYPTDVFLISYASNAFGIFKPSFSGTTITLSAWVNPGNVTLPVVSGNLPKFSGTTGLMVDSLISPSNAAKTKLASVNAATVANEVATFSDTAGTVQSSGTLLSALQLSANIKAVSVSWAGGGTSNAFTVTGVTTSSIVIASIFSSANAVNIESAKVLAPDALTVTFSGDPGAVVLNVVAFIVAQ